MPAQTWQFRCDDGTMMDGAYERGTPYTCDTCGHVDRRTGTLTLTYGPHKHVVEGLIADVLNQAMRDLAIRNAVRAGF